MITLSVVSFNGSPTSAGPSVAFDELGGTIGRADTNQMVLSDPDRTVSRVHAQVVYRNGQFAVVDRGSNPIAVNGRQLGQGQEAPLQAGDQLQIGGYLLVARLGAAAASRSAADPFADLLGPAAAPSRRGTPADFDPLAGLAEPPPSRPPAPAHAGGIPDDWDPFAPPAPPPPGSRGADPFAPLGGLGLDTGAAAPAPLVPDLSPPAADSLDSLFGLKSAPLGADPLGGSALQAAAAQPNMAAAADPLAALSALPRASAESLPDHLSELQRPYLPPAARPEPPAAALPPAVHPAAQGAVLSWDADAQALGGQTLIRPRAAHPPGVPAAPAGRASGVDPVAAPAATDPFAAAAAIDPFAAALPSDPLAASPAGDPFAAALGGDPFAPVAAGDPRSLNRVAPPPHPAPTAPPTVPSTAVPDDLFGAAAAAPRPTLPVPAPVAAPVAPVALAAGADAASVQALLVAFKEGLGMPGVSVPALTPELMRVVGQLLGEAAQGTVDLLVARAAMKREVRAEATMIMARENNPLKFSPSAEVALGHLLAPPLRGFMPAAPAMRDAYNDLRAHQYGFVAGMRAALDGVLQRFDPAQLEGQLTQLSALQSLLPGARKARLWESFQALYAQLRADATDDFHTVFGQAFLKAYEAHIDSLERGTDAS